MALNDYIHGRDAPVGASFGCGGFKQGQPNEGDGGGDGQRPNETHEKADNTREADHDLEERGHHDGALQLWRRTPETRRP